MIVESHLMCYWDSADTPPQMRYCKCLMCALPYTTLFRGSEIRVPQNGETNTRLGVYRSLCCGAEIVLLAGVEFPDCPNHLKLTTTWKGVRDEHIPRAGNLASSKKKDSDSAA